MGLVRYWQRSTEDALQILRGRGFLQLSKGEKNTTVQLGPPKMEGVNVLSYLGPPKTWSLIPVLLWNFTGKPETYVLIFLLDCNYSRKCSPPYLSPPTTVGIQP